MSRKGKQASGGDRPPLQERDLLEQFDVGHELSTIGVLRNVAYADSEFRSLTSARTLVGIQNFVSPIVTGP